MQDDDPPMILFPLGLQASDQVELLTCVELETESANRFERLPFDHDEGAGEKAGKTAHEIPSFGSNSSGEATAVQSNCASDRDNTRTGRRRDRVGEKLPCRPRVRVDEQDPFARGRPGPGVPGTTNLVHWLEDHPSPGSGCNLRSPVRRIVVTDDPLVSPPSVPKSPARLPDGPERCREQPLLVECRYHHRHLRPAKAWRRLRDRVHQESEQIAEPGLSSVRKSNP